MRKKVLIVDDDSGMQDAFLLIFERAGYATTVLTSANSIMDGTAPVPDIYILDRQLSGADGLDICRFLKAQSGTADTPVIMVSATPNIAPMAKAACADDFLEKPFGKTELLNMVARQLALKTA